MGFIGFKLLFFEFRKKLEFSIIRALLKDGCICYRRGSLNVFLRIKISSLIMVSS